MKQELRFATSCDYSAWIAASAGTGKTRLLTNRIINLLLSGVDPRSILCLTFTKAAKGEMLARISNVLRNFTTQTEEEIREFFAENFEKSINNNEIQRIKDFYQKYISEGKVVEIYTIHAFCQNLLQKFPLEAGLRPYFKVIDETRVSRFIAKILLSSKTTLLIDEVMQNNLSLFTIKELIEELAQFYLDLDLGDKAIDAVNILLKDRLSAKSTEEIGILYNRLIAKIQENHEVIKQVVGLSDLLDLELIGADNSDICQNDYINKLLSNVDIISFFLTLSGQKRKKLISRKDISKLAPQTEELLQELQDYIFTIKSAVDLNNGIEINSSILRLANFIFTEYKKYKEINNFLDYQDLINSSYNLLCNSDIKDWIKYKLDGGIDHILVDESQDTSQEQWNIIIALLEDFFSGDSRKYNKSKTIFVVGDVKQSIYSFQGARPDLFSEAKNYIKERALGAKARFIECNLEKTFRLPELIFNFVYRIFRDINLIENLIELEIVL